MSIYIIIAEFRNGQKKVAGYSSSKSDAEKAVAKAEVEICEGKRFDKADWRIVNFTPTDIKWFQIIPVQEISSDIEIHWTDKYQDEDYQFKDFPTI